MKIVLQLLTLVSVVVAPGGSGANQREGKSPKKHEEEKDKAEKTREKQQERKRKRRDSQQQQEERKRLRLQVEHQREKIPQRKEPQHLRPSVIVQHHLMPRQASDLEPQGDRTGTTSSNPQRVQRLRNMHQRVTVVQSHSQSTRELLTKILGAKEPIGLQPEKMTQWQANNHKLMGKQQSVKNNLSIANQIKRQVQRLLQESSQSSLDSKFVKARINQSSLKLEQLTACSKAIMEDIKQLMDERMIIQSQEGTGQQKRSATSEGTSKQKGKQTQRTPDIELPTPQLVSQEDIQPPKQPNKRKRSRVNPQKLQVQQKLQAQALIVIDEAEKRSIQSSVQEEASLQLFDQEQAPSKTVKKKTQKPKQLKLQGQISFTFVDQHGKIVIDNPFKERLVTFKFGDYLFTPANAYFTEQTSKLKGNKNKQPALKLTSSQVDLLNMEIAVLTEETKRLTIIRHKLQNDFQMYSRKPQVKLMAKTSLVLIPKLLTAAAIQTQLKRFLLSGCQKYNRFKQTKTKRQYSKFKDRKLKQYFEKKKQALLSQGYLQQADLKGIYEPSVFVQSKLTGLKRTIRRDWEFNRPNEAEAHILTEQEKSWETQGVVNGDQQSLSSGQQDVFETYSDEEDD